MADSEERASAALATAQASDDRGEEAADLLGMQLKVAESGFTQSAEVACEA